MNEPNVVEQWMRDGLNRVLRDVTGLIPHDHVLDACCKTFATYIPDSVPTNHSEDVAELVRAARRQVKEGICYCAWARQHGEAMCSLCELHSALAKFPR